MLNGINEISPNLRDYLLNRNLILSDTIVNAGLIGMANGLGKEVNIETLPNAVKPSSNIEEDGVFYRDLNLAYNPYKTDNENDKIIINTNTVGNIGNLPPGGSPVSYQQNIASKINDSSFTKSANETRSNILVKNKYYDESLFYEVNLNTVLQSPKNVGPYEIRNNLLNRSIDFILNSVNLGGVAQQFNNAQLETTPLEDIANKEIIKHFGYNAAFGLGQETLGHINLNPISLLNGKDIIVPNYSITIAKGGLGSAVDFLSRVTGVEIPKSLLSVSSSIFAKENPVSNTDRLQSQILNTGKGQVTSLISNLKENKYKPTITDGRKRENITKGDTGIDGELYAFEGNNGEIIDLLNSPTPTTESNAEPFIDGVPNPNYLSDAINKINETEFESSHGKISSELDGNFNDKFDSPDGFDTNISTIDEAGITKFSWGDDKLNKDAQQIFDKNIFTNKKSLVYKTQALFNSNKMRTLVSGRGDGTLNNKKSEIQSAVQVVGGNEYISKGSGVLSKDAVLGELKSGATPDKVYCRAWTTFHRYNQVRNLQKNSGLLKNAGSTIRKNINGSVLDDNGFARIGPDRSKKEDGSFSPVEVKRYMFSIENLAWSDSTAFLPECEKGPGDPITGTKGRIMWFPPYNLNFTDNSSVSWDSTNFIGRGEPIYTYNHTERGGTLQWQIIIDYATYVNDLKNSNFNSDDVFASIAAGCLDIDSVVSDKLSQIEKDLYELNTTKEKEKISAEEQVPPPTFKIYFPNDSTAISTDYENGDGVGLGTTMPDDGYITTERSGGIHPYKDRTDFGLNSCTLPTGCPQGQKITLDGKEFNGWANNTFLTELAIYLVEKCPACRIRISGYASKDGQLEAPSANQRLSEDRANNVKNKLLNELLFVNDPLATQRFEFVKGSGAEGCDNNSEVDSYCKKEARRVEISFVYDPLLDEKLKKSEKPKEIENTIEISNEIKKRYFNECSYFEKLKEDTPFIYETIKEKVRYFHPGFHSVTPEGFNSRLNFLKQCTRQGPTLKNGVPNNLSFGKPPVCILRLGDFYHTKIIVENVQFSFDPLVWDLNPEGVGVQPMICNVDMSFKFIGGSSLEGPINRLQNAVSFNFFANTEIYDDRADYIKKSNDTDKDYVIVNGINPNNYDEPPKIYKNQYNLKSGIGNNESPTVDQVSRAENDLNE